MHTEDHKERVDRELNELLNELRVALPGVQVLFAFLLGIAFTSRFESVSSLQRGVYFATLMLTAAATALLIAPSAYHRIHFRSGTDEKERMLFTATHMTVVGLALLWAATTGAMFLVADILYSSEVALIAAAGLAALMLWVWFALPLARRAR